ncbi:MAG TPA: O-antigen ligase family protein [Chthoniobacterales bacterium]|nr:O-antigen ligase family protein [Chthoniobacterales bacterium]
MISSALFFGYILVRAIFSPAPYIARSDIYSVLGGLIVYFFVSFFFTSPKQRTAFWLFLLAIAIVHVGIGAVQFRGGQNFMPISFLQRGYDYGARASGFYICPNHLAGFLEVAGIFGLSIVCWSRWPVWSKMLIGYATAVCYFGIVLTGSRGGYLSTAASLIVFGALSLITLRRTTPRLFWTAGAAGALAALIVGLAALFLFHKSDYLSERAQNIIDKKNVRIDMWQAAVEQWKLQPFLGTGSGTYLYYGRQFRTERVQQDPVEVHNDYLQLLAEYGLVGTSLFVLFLIAHLHNGWKNFRRLGPGRVARSSRVLSNSFTLNVGAIAAVCAHIVHSFVDFNLHIPANVLLLALVFGSLANAGVRRETESSPTLALSPSLFRWRLALPIIGVVVLVQVVRLLPAEYLAEHARTAIRDDKADIAARFAERALKIDNQNPYLFQYLGAARLQQSALAKEPQTKIVLDLAALEAFTKARALAPRDKDFILAIASIYDALGRFNESEWLYSEALRLDPRSIYTKQGYDIHVEQWRDRGGLAQSDAVAPHS